MLLRVLGIAAIAGGVLRILDSFTAESFSPRTLALLYLITDVLLLFGIAGVYWSRRTTLGIAGVAGVAVFAFGILWIRFSAFTMAGISGYRLGAAISLIGLAVLSAEELLRGRGADSAPIFWLAALLFAVAGALGLMVSLTTIAAGVAFGAGFIMAGRRVLAT
jgi:hypothetical protein